MLEAVREVTKWTGLSYTPPNHDYLLDGNRIVAYRRWGQGPCIPQNIKLMLDRRGRKFVKLNPNPFAQLISGNRDS
jgi:hypothetical protein